jgi:hypothetical protein
MDQPSNQQADWFGDMARTANVMLFVVRVWATSIEVFIRRGMGRRYLGLHAAAVLLLVPLYCLFWELYDVRPMVWFLEAYVGMLLVSRISRLRRGKEDCHSYYDGFPRMLKSEHWECEVRFKRINEPLLVGCLGAGIVVVSQPLGWYVIIGAIALAIQSEVWEQWEAARAMDIHDAMLEQSFLAKRLRSKSRN